MAESAQIAKLTPRHDLILDYLIANPTQKRSEVALAFGVTAPWLSTIIHSDIFQEKLAARQDEFFSIAVTPIHEKINALADIALDRLIDSTLVDERSDSLRDTLKLTLDSLGYGRQAAAPPSAGGDQHVHFHGCDPQILADARQRIFNRKQEKEVSHEPALLEGSVATEEL